jgi:hypothetical protein
MTSFAQWRSPGSRLATARAEARPRQYDTRKLDHFYAYCSAVSRADRIRDAVVASQHAIQRRIWGLLIGASILGYYLVDRVAQAMSLF